MEVGSMPFPFPAEEAGSTHYFRQDGRGFQEDMESVNLEESRFGPVAPCQADKEIKNGIPKAHVQHRLEAAYRSRKASSACSYSVLVSRFPAVASSVAGRIQNVRDEKPLYLVAMMTGTAVALGIVFRVWRSHHE